MEVVNKGYVIWLTGISGSGKTTLSKMVYNILSESKNKIALLDGDTVRDFFEHDLSYTKADRLANIKRMAFAAYHLSENGIHVIVANMAHYYEGRDFIRRKINNYIQIYVKASVDIVKKRDVKGLYQKFENDLIFNIIGLDDQYQAPRCPNLIVDTDVESSEESCLKILQYLESINVFELEKYYKTGKWTNDQYTST